MVAMIGWQMVSLGAESGFAAAAALCLDLRHGHICLQWHQHGTYNRLCPEAMRLGMRRSPDLQDYQILFCIFFIVFQLAKGTGMIIASRLLSQ